MQRIAAAVYGIVCDIVFFGTLLYAIAFVSNICVPQSVEADPNASEKRRAKTNANVAGE